MSQQSVKKDFLRLNREISDGLQLKSHINETDITLHQEIVETLVFPVHQENVGTLILPD